MKIKSVIVNGRRENFSLEVIPMGERLYKLSKPLYVRIYTDEGVFTFAFDFGFITNFRSGGVLVDFFLDQIGTTLVQLAYLLHDACYTPCFMLAGEHPVSKKLADELLKAMLIYAGMSSWKASLVHTSVKLFGKSAYEEDDDLTEENSRLFTFLWSDK